jgi:intracellular multiplication protein IcmO
MALDKKYEHKHTNILRDTRPFRDRVAETMRKPAMAATMFFFIAFIIWQNPAALAWADAFALFLLIYFFWLRAQDRTLAFKLPMGSKHFDGNNKGGGRGGKAEGILYLGNVDKTNEEVWFTNSDSRTHFLYLGTTGAGKTEGLKSMVTNALTWGSGFVYVDGKADTDLWSSLSALVRRFGRDDDLMVLNYMTGNSDVKAPSNTMNPFSSGSASYLTNMLVSLMPESEGDNAMWKERAVSLAGAMMPILTWKRDNQDMPLSVRTIRDNLSLNNVIKLSRDAAVPEVIRSGVKGYLDTLPGFVGDAYDDNGAIKPPSSAGPPPDTTTANQQHGYLAMQFTRSLQSLGDDYGYIFDTQAADIDMVDIVLNRRILIVLIPALEKSGDEIANLGKIVASTIKGMMGSTLGANVEGSSETVIDNKVTHSATPFMTVFDEVGYYVAQGMAVMAAQARSLGFCLVFSSQDLPALKKRVREEANSITANCNIKIFGKLEDPTETKEFFEKTVGTSFVTEVSGFQTNAGATRSYMDTRQASVQLRPRAAYDGLRTFTEGKAVVTFSAAVTDCNIFYCNPGHAKAMRVSRFMALPPMNEEIIKHANSITKLRDLMVNKAWTAEKAEVAAPVTAEIKAIAESMKKTVKSGVNPVDIGIAAIIKVHALTNPLDDVTDDQTSSSSSGAATPGTKIPPIVSTPPANPPAPAAAAPPSVSPLAALKPQSQPMSSPASENTVKAPATSGNPMSFFGSKTPTDNPVQTTQAAPPPPPVPPVAAPVIQQTPPPVVAPPSSAPQQESPQKESPKLPQSIQDIIEQAAREAKKSIIKDEE